MKSKTKKPWVQTGGGTGFFRIKGPLKYYPSDASYKNTRTGRRILIRAETGAYFALPDRVRKPSDLLRRAGVYGRIFKDIEE